ncbi:hypothetical protein HDU67_002210 [Dinochytrium kinnereticum]|nr:hypothetical protein HDU67_002210 [Dinochytrium kinnereticum]
MELTSLTVHRESSNDQSVGDSTTQEGFTAYPDIVLPYAISKAHDDSLFNALRLSELPSGLLHPGRKETDPVTSPDAIEVALDWVAKVLGLGGREDNVSATPVRAVALPEAASLALKNVYSGLEVLLDRLSSVVGRVGLDKKRVLSLLDGGASEAYQKTLERLEQAPVKGIAWHPYRHAVAFAHRQDSIRLVDLTAKNAWHPPAANWDGLKHPLQKDVTCIAWRPCASATFAVGCKDGVCIWTVHPLDSKDSLPLGQGEFTINPAFMRSASVPGNELLSSKGSTVPPLFPSMPESLLRNDGVPGTPPALSPKARSERKAALNTPLPPTWMNFLSYPGMTNVTSLAWSPDGTRLAVGCATSPKLVIWDISTETPYRIPAGVGSGTKHLRWSADGTHLAQICFKRTLRVWETEEFSSFEIEAVPRGFADACWVDGSKTLAFAVEGDSRVSMLQVLERNTKGLEYRMHPQPERMSRFETYTENGNPIIVGGPIKAMEIDPTMKRFAVIFEEQGEGGQLVALFEVKKDPLPEFLPIGFIRGPKWTEDLPSPHPPRSPFASTNKGTQASSNQDSTQQPRPVLLRFANQYPHGALLTVAWESGKVGFIPCLFGTSDRRGF